jgi:hypothetical protein
MGKETFLMKTVICDCPKITATVSYSWEGYSVHVNCTEDSGAIYLTDPADGYGHLRRKNVEWSEIPEEIKEIGRKALLGGSYGYYNILTPYAVRMLGIKTDFKHLREAIISRLESVSDGYLTEIALKIGKVPFSKEGV